MRPLPFSPLVSVAALAALGFLGAGCDQLNKPFNTSSSSSSSSSGSSNASHADGGDAESDGGTLAPLPTITAQPGDIQL